MSANPKGHSLVSICADSLSKSKMDTLMGSELPPFLAHRSAKDKECVTLWAAHRAHGLRVFVQKQVCCGPAWPPLKINSFWGFIITPSGSEAI